MIANWHVIRPPWLLTLSKAEYAPLILAYSEVMYGF